MRVLGLIALVAFLGAVLTTILFFVGVGVTAGIAFILGSIALTSGFVFAVSQLSSWDKPNQKKWPMPWTHSNGG
jgi:hypothetical protein